MTRNEQVELIAKLRGSFLLFVQTFFPLVNAKSFDISNPIEREPHAVQISRMLTRFLRGTCDTPNGIINIAPGSGKCIHEETKITMSNGCMVSAHDVEVGDLVKSLDEFGEKANRRVIAKDYVTDYECLKITTAAGRELICSREHRWLSSSGFLEAQALRVQDDLITPHSLTSLTSNDALRRLSVLIEEFGHLSVELESRYFECVTRDTASEIQHHLMLLGYISRVEQFIGYCRVTLHLESFKDLLSDLSEHGADVWPDGISKPESFKYKSDFKKYHLAYDRIISIEPELGEQHLIDFQIEETENFIANGVVSHNSTLMSYWTAWCLAQYPDSKFLYISYSKRLASNHTHNIKKIMMLSAYRELFNVDIAGDTKAKDYFQTNHNGAVAAFGSGGSITGMDAGLPTSGRFTGAIILDDVHKPDSVHSDVMRDGVIQNFRETIKTRKRNPSVPLIFIGQRLHEDDLGGYLARGDDGEKWDKLVIKSVDINDRSFYPEVYPIETLHRLQEYEPYVFASQHQQDPIPAGGALFKPHWFVSLNTEPEFIETFITADTAETDKTYNDATVFSFWGVYKLDGEELGLHWIDCAEIRVEPKDLQMEFESFYQQCTLHKKRPNFAAIEKKSTGTTLVSVLESMRGLRIKPIERTRASGSKTQRFLACQPHVAAQKISFTDGAKHKKLCVDHMSKITALDTHRFDDICDTLADAVHITYELKSFDNSTPYIAHVIPKSHRAGFR